MTKAVCHCAHCGAIVERFPSHIKSRVFCNRSCQDAYGKVSLTCAWRGCNRTFPGRVSTHHGKTVYKTAFTRNGSYSIFRLCEHHTALLRRYGMRANSLDRIWKHPDRRYGTRGISARGLQLVLFDQAGHQCQGCGISLSFTEKPKRWIVDHIRPIFQGGQTTIENLQILCRSCDSTKTAVEKSAAALLRHRGENGHRPPRRWLTHHEKDIMLAQLIAERDALRAQLHRLTAAS